MQSIEDLIDAGICPSCGQPLEFEEFLGFYEVVEQFAFCPECGWDEEDLGE